MKARAVLGLVALGILAGAGVAMFPAWLPSNFSSEKSEKLPNLNTTSGLGANTPDPNSNGDIKKNPESKSTKLEILPNKDNSEQGVNSYGIQVYHIQPKGDRLAAVPTTVKAKSDEKALREALLQLFSQSKSEPKSENAKNNVKDNNLHSEIPAQTKLLDLSMQGKEIRLNLSQEFTSGGGTASMNGRLAQVLYTATSLDHDAKLYLSVEGKPLKYLGGEGLEVPQPATRKDFAAEF